MPSTNNQKKSGHTSYSEIEVIRHPDGVCAVITERDLDGRVSFMIAREYDDHGVTKRSAYVARRHLPAVIQIMADLQERLELAEDRARARRRA